MTRIRTILSVLAVATALVAGAASPAGAFMKPPRIMHSEPTNLTVSDILSTGGHLRGVNLYEDSHGRYWNCSDSQHCTPA